MTRKLEPGEGVERPAEPQNRAERVVAFLRRRALFLIVGLVVVAGGLSFFASRIKIDNSLRVWFVEGDPALEAYDAYQETFGNDETVVVAVIDGKGVYRPTTLERIRAASKRLEEHERVRRVSSIAVGLHVSGEDGFVQVEKLLGDEAVTDAEAAAVARRVAMNPVFKGTIVGDSDKVTLILVTPKSSDDFEHTRGALIGDIRSIAKTEIEQGSDGLRVHLGGIGVVYEGLNQASVRDTSIFTTLSYLIIFIGLWVLFRRWVWVLIGAGVITVANLATLGVAGAAGRDMNMVTAVLPTLIMTIGILDLVHLIDAFEHERASRRELPRGRVLLSSLAVVLVPCVFNTITDVAGFMALTSAKMSAVRDLGWLAGVGLSFLLLAILIIGVPAIARFGGRGRAAESRNPESGWVMAVVMRCFRIARDRRPLVFAVTIVLIGVSAYGITRVDVDTYSIGFLDEDDPVRVDHDAIEAAFGPYIPLEFTVEAPAPPPAADPDAAYAGVKDPDLLRRIDAVERGFEAHPDVARATGLPEVVKRVNQIWSDEAPGSYAVPDKAGIVAEQLLNYGFEPDGRDHLDDLVTPDWRRTHITARTGLPSARAIAATVADLETIADREMGDAGTAAPAGYLPLYVRIIQHITDAQIRSFSIALCLVTLILMLLLRSVKLGLIAMVPNVLPAAMTLAFMGLVGIQLDVASVLIAAIAIGISVNDTSHIMFRYRHELGRTPDDPEGAVRRMMLHAGRPVVASSVILVAGFAVLLMASVKSVAYFGMLTSATIVSALVADLIVTPALLLSLARRST